MKRKAITLTIIFVLALLVILPDVEVMATDLDFLGIEIGAIFGGSVGYAYCWTSNYGCQLLYKLFSFSEEDYDFEKPHPTLFPEGPQYHAMNLGRAVGAATVVTLQLPDDKRSIMPFAFTLGWAIAANFMTDVLAFYFSLPGIPAALAYMGASSGSEF